MTHPLLPLPANTSQRGATSSVASAIAAATEPVLQCSQRHTFTRGSLPPIDRSQGWVEVTRNGLINLAIRQLPEFPTMSPYTLTCLGRGGTPSSIISSLAPPPDRME
eukprot:4987981-Heterocapsa_arctica.AAC.1